MGNYFDQYDTGEAPLKITVTKGADKANYFDQYDPPSYGADVAKSAGIGLAKGAVGLAGMVGDLSDLGAKGIDTATRYVTDKLGMDSPPPYQGQPSAIGSQAIQHGIEQTTGPFYEPQTTPGRFAQTAAEFVPGALVGGGAGLARNAVRYGILPGLASEGAGEATEGTALEPYARFAAPVLAGGAAAAMSRPATAERALASKLPEFVEPQHIADAEQMIQQAQARGINLTWPEALSQVAGRPVLSDVQRVLESAPQSRTVMSDFYGARPQQIGTAANAEFGNIAPPTGAPSNIGPAVGRAAEDHINETRDGINQVAQPFYDAAQTVRLTPMEMARVRNLPGYEEASHAVRNDPQLNRYVAQLPEDSVGFLNEVKKYLDTAATNASAPVNVQRNMQRSAGYGSDATNVRDSAVNATLGNPRRDYETALAIEQHGRETFLQPLLNGPLGKLASRDTTTKAAIEALFPSNPLAGSEHEITTAVTALTARNPGAARQLVRAHVEMKLDEAFNRAGRGQEAAQFAGASFANRVSGSPVVDTQRLANLRAAVEALPNGQHVWPGFRNFLDIARATGTRQPIGSKTAFNDVELHSMQTGSLAGNIVKEAASPERWISMVHEYWGRWQLGRNLDQLARIITDPASRAILNRISNLPTGSREAQLLVARVIGISAAGQHAQAASEKPRNAIGQ